MGKRKKSSRKPMGPKKSDPLPSTFTCLFCNHEKAVTVKLDKKAGVGNLDCRVCGQNFQCAVNYLSAAVDVYGEWVDAADSVAKEGGRGDSAYVGTSRSEIGGDVSRTYATGSQGNGSTAYNGHGVVADYDDDDDDNGY